MAERSRTRALPFGPSSDVPVAWRGPLPSRGGRNYPESRISIERELEPTGSIATLSPFVATYRDAAKPDRAQRASRRDRISRRGLTGATLGNLEVHRTNT